MSDALGVNELAAVFGVTRRTISDLSRRGVIARRGRGFDQDESTRRYCAHLREIKAGRGQAAGAVAAVSSRARLAAAQAEAVELKNAVAEGALISEALIESEWAEIVTRIRNAILIEPERIGAELGLPRASVAISTAICATCWRVWRGRRNDRDRIPHPGEARPAASIEAQRMARNQRDIARGRERGCRSLEVVALAKVDRRRAFRSRD